jgi:putative ABC transport system substrate-binding protein
MGVLRRRDVIAAFGCAALWPTTARAQQQSLPTVGYIVTNKLTAEGSARTLSGVRRGLAELGYTEGKNFQFEFKSAELHYEKYPGFVQELARQHVSLIVVSSTAALEAAKSNAPQSIPIVFTIGSDPVENNFVASLSKPSGNITGVFTLNLSLAGKRLELLRELVPSATKFGFMTNPASPKFDVPETKEIQAAARLLGIDIVTLNARTLDDFETAFKTSVREGLGGIVVGSEALFITFPAPLVKLADQYRVPVIYADENPAKAGGLISNGADQDEGYRILGNYAARVLKGEKPADTPVQQSTKTTLAINLKTANAMKIKIPIPLLGRADEVIE